MHHRAQAVPFRNLVWIESQSFEGWGCDKCAWIFNPSGLPTGKTLDEMKEHFQTQLSQEFAAHACDGHPKPAK